MRTVITTREYDDNGRMIRETVTEHDDHAKAVAPVYPNGCVCSQPWHSITPRTCPVHGASQLPMIWCGQVTSDRGYILYNGAPSNTASAVLA